MLLTWDHILTLQLKYKMITGNIIYSTVTDCNHKQHKLEVSENQHHQSLQPSHRINWLNQLCPNSIRTYREHTPSTRRPSVNVKSCHLGMIKLPIRGTNSWSPHTTNSPIITSPLIFLEAFDGSETIV